MCAREMVLIHHVCTRGVPFAAFHAPTLWPTNDRLPVHVPGFLKFLVHVGSHFVGESEKPAYNESLYPESLLQLSLVTCS